MNSTTKRIRLYIVQGNYWYGHGWEDLTTAEDRRHAMSDLRAYQFEERGTYRLVRRWGDVPA